MLSFSLSQAEQKRPKNRKNVIKEKDNLKIEDNPKNEDELKNEDNPKLGQDLAGNPFPNLFLDMMENFNIDVKM